MTLEVSKMEIELFSASTKTGKIRIAGIEAVSMLQELRIIVNGTDITDTLRLEEIRIISEKQEKKAQ